MNFDNKISQSQGASRANTLQNFSDDEYDAPVNKSLGASNQSTIQSATNNPAETDTPKESKGFCGTITSALSSAFEKIKSCFTWIFNKICCCFSKKDEAKTDPKTDAAKTGEEVLETSKS